MDRQARLRGGSALDQLLNRTSFAHESPHRRKQRQTEQEKDKARLFLASKELNPEVRDRLLRNEEPPQGSHERVIRNGEPFGGSELKKRRFNQSQDMVRLVAEEDNAHSFNERSFLRDLALEREDPMNDMMKYDEHESKHRTKRVRQNHEEEPSDRQKQTEKEANVRSFEAFKRASKRDARLSRCAFCMDSELCQKIRKDLFIACSDEAYLASMSKRDLLVPFHTTLCPLDHVANSVNLSTRTLEDIRDFKKAMRSFLRDPALSAIMESCGYDSGPYKPVYVEWFLPSKGEESSWKQASMQSMGHGSHFSIDILPLTEDGYEEAKMTVAQEFGSLSGDVNRVNKGFRKLEPSPRRGPKDVIPKGSIPYIYIDFGMSQAFVHTLEKEALSGNLTQRVDRDFMRRLMKSFYPEDVWMMGIKGLNWDEYLRLYKKAFLPYDWSAQPNH
eukprot:Blabericola_migrator_1__7973@NODE_408_length_8774_cov_256_148501_g321_i0_p2_GENE_NODE_408_length_8774_cov_256_148501_g321_i0NODE_408_length_8774_cov_256_148501_g321_i0_p2_ORF_typecomplete_len445_score59_00CwfJ_C_1/PF04677_15/5_3e12Hepcidin/PF06446_12/0_061CwfJ_C_2/PF04676_14/4_9e03CwfJ_C_2/PF04676_14/3e03CwfJ_C_2/PF04676_14/0_014_NODE_408_length_8774_cov_256_148501_g321_i044715805